MDDSAFDLVAGLFLLGTAFALWHLKWIRRLPKTFEHGGEDTTSRERFRCSIVMAARNEEARIEQTVRRLLAQQEVSLELIVVDDRSTDATSQILARLGNEDSRVRAMRVDVLPDGWLGKCHACHLGASQATGDWILFTDGDCWLKPDVLARALHAAEHQKVDHITIASGFASGSFGLRASHLMFFLSLADWFSGVNRDRPKAYIGIGAFNLVRASAYRVCGGYEALRLTVVDDVKLGLLLRRAGKRTRAFLGGDDIECHWGTNLWNMIKVFEKNYFAAIDFRTGLVIGGSLAVITVVAILIFGLFSQTPAGIAATASPLSFILPGIVLTRRLNWSWHYALGVPLMIPVFLIALLNSTLVTLRQGGVRWRDTFYPLEVLRAGNVR